MAEGNGEGRVLGIGGIFLRTDDPGGMAAWYRDNLGIVVTAAGQPDPEGNWTWRQDAGDTVFSMFERKTDYFPADRQVMLNLRVSGLDALVARLSAAGIGAERRDEWDHPDIGRFARIHDPEGNPIELWEPPTLE
ncbi:glyoxalase [Novosphingobium marinum]|uniref:Putative enzyme related to lactoylglutathione lyase n=1 Tax=Novosphingobium marinum TaxID=1514948 RepID=A0A7Y9XWS2_9SPHN|nr:VOC family protein [Novosphingobium marinum]NYH95979.1 putative enzyme related to lactoylglutathione lyase [Novosphingobium marinum]GGC31521.1 glyoxalase [Novosphingobium marinum]